MRRLRLPVEVWQRGGSKTIRVETTTLLRTVQLDPAGLLPDVDRANNRWQVPALPAH